MAFIEQHPETIIFGGQIAEFGENVNDIVAYRNVPTSAKEIIKFTQKRCPFNHMTVAYQKSAVINWGNNNPFFIVCFYISFHLVRSIRDVCEVYHLRIFY